MLNQARCEILEPEVEEDEAKADAKKEPSEEDKAKAVELKKQAVENLTKYLEKNPNPEDKETIEELISESNSFINGDSSKVQE